MLRNCKGVIASKAKQSSAMSLISLWIAAARAAPRDDAAELFKQIWHESSYKANPSANLPL
jgi:hypothetical protein